MSDTILGGDFTVHYDESQTGGRDRRQIIWTGGTNAARTVNELYSALQDLFDDSAQMDDRVPMTAQTPTDYTMVNGWFIDDTSVENLTGGTIQTSGWATDEVVEFEYTDTSGFAGSDIGLLVTEGASGDTGTLLDYNDVTTTQHAWVRPDVPGADQFDTAGAMAVTGGTATPGDVVVATNVSGEAIWANPITIASLASNTLVYIYQNIDDTTTAGSDNKTRVIATKGTDSWWGEGNIDILLKVQNAGSLIDQGYATFFARQYSQLYSHSVVNLSAGARTSIALETQNDLNNDEGFKQFITNAETGAGWSSADVGERINEDIATPTWEAILTSVSGTGPNYTMQFYPVADLTLPIASDVFEDSGATKDATLTAAAPTNVNPAAGTDATITVTHGFTSKDLINGNGAQPYSIVIDAQATPINDVYERLKYVTRRGETGTGSTDGIAGEEYIGNEYALNIGTITTSFAEGEQLWMHDSGNALVATGIVVANHGAAEAAGLQLRNFRRYTSNAITQVGDNVAQASYTDSASVTAERAISPVKASPFGTFAGGVFFGAPGVWIEDLFSGDEQAFQLTDDLGVVQTPPNTVSVTVTNLISGDSVAVFRRLTSVAGSNVDKDEFASVAVNNALGDSTFEVGAAPGGEIPTSGKIRVVDFGTQEEHRYRYSSIGTAPDAFILATASAGTADGGDADTLVDSGADFVTDGVEVGDLIYNTPETSYHRVTGVTNLTTLETEPFPGQAAIPSTWNGDAYSINTLVQLYDASDNVWVPIIDETATATTASDTLILEAAGGQDSDGSIHVRVVVRRNVATAILPFETDTTITSTGGLSQAAIRNPDTITS